MKSSKLHTKYLWVDLEMTGLNVEKERIIEIAAIITDTQLKELGSFHRVVFQKPELLAAMDEWNQTHHKASGLLEEIPQAQTEEQVESALIAFVKEYFSEPIILAGNTIGQDRLFLEKYFKKFSKLLHYRQLDVTSLKLPFLVENIKYEKKNSHRALDDIRESIGEFKFLWSHFKA